MINILVETPPVDYLKDVPHTIALTTPELDLTEAKDKDKIKPGLLQLEAYIEDELVLTITSMVKVTLDSETGVFTKEITLPM